jgi:hypothetical protein
MQRRAQQQLPLRRTESQQAWYAQPQSAQSAPTYAPRPRSQSQSRSQSQPCAAVGQMGVPALGPRQPLVWAMGKYQHWQQRNFDSVKDEDSAKEEGPKGGFMSPPPWLR